MLELDYGSATSAGAVRDLNEDAAVALANIFAVADGLGGHAAGEIASGFAVTHLGKLAGRDDLHSDEIQAAIAETNAAILASSARHGEQVGMGTTVAGLAVIRVGGTEHWLAFNIGDSRIYRYADQQLIQLSVDHSEVAELMALGRITPAQARSHPMRNVVTRSLGTDPAPTPDLWVFPPSSGDRFLLCSDGLTLELEDAEICAILAAQPRPQEAADRLVERAVGAGGRDNVTAIVIDLAVWGQTDVVDARTAPRVRPSGG